MPLYRHDMIGILSVAFYEYIGQITYYLSISNIDYMFEVKMTEKQMSGSSISFQRLFIQESRNGSKIINENSYHESYLTA